MLQCRHECSTILSKYQGGGSTLHGRNMLSIVKTWPGGLPKRLHHFASPPAINESFYCSTSSPAFGVIRVPDFDHFHRSAVVSYCCFNLHFSEDIYHGAYFHMFLCHLCVFFGEMSVKVTFEPFLNGFVCFLIIEFEFFA